MENWLPVVGHEGFYKISNIGRVRSLSRVGKYRMYKGRILKPCIKNGYHAVFLSINNTGKQYYVHQLVLAAFVGPRPSERHCTNHKNGIRTDNNIGNLEWVTYRENNLHSHHVLGRKPTSNLQPTPKGGWANQRGEKNPAAKLTDDDVRYIKAAVQSTYYWGLMTKLACKFNVGVPTISMIVNGHRWEHVIP